jgi:hypothetical protein
MKHLGFGIVLFLISLGASDWLDAQPSAAPQSAVRRSSYDPMARAKDTGQPKGMVETTLAGVNPQDKDYGEVVAGWRKEIFENTINRAYWWGLIVLGLGLGFSVATNGWLMRERERRLAISADVVTQLFNAYIGSRAKALEVVARYNSLVDRYNRLDGEKMLLADQLAGLSAKSSDSELDYNQARADRVPAPSSRSAASQVTSQIALDFDQETPEVENLRSQVSEFETKLQRKTAQLQAKDNQITNLRERLSRAHDSLEGQRKPKAQAS